MTAKKETYDLVIVGSGAGGLISGFFAVSRGLKTLIIEKTEFVGGTTAYSGAGIWYPGSGPIERAGHAVAAENSRQYFHELVKMHAQPDDISRSNHIDAYLETGGKVIEELEGHSSWGNFMYVPGIPDYFAKVSGASPAGNTIFPPDVSIEELGEEVAALVRSTLPNERWGEPMGEILSGGRALIGRALKGFLDSGLGTLRMNTALTKLIVENEKVVGVEAKTGEQILKFGAEHAVLLAAGGFERNRDLLTKHQADFRTGEDSNGAPQNTGDALLAGLAVGAGTALLDESWFIPGVVQPDGKPLFHSLTRGGVWVNADGKRFVNETAPYDQAGHAIYHGQKNTGVTHSPAYWIIDQRHLDRDNLGAPPGQPLDLKWFESGALKKFDSVEAVADYVGAEASVLRETIEEFNSYSKDGIDRAFHRGETPWDQFGFVQVGYPAGTSYPLPLDPTNSFVNPLVQPIEGPPYLVLEIRLSDIGTKGGLLTDIDGSVLGEDGNVIDGLYATGNTMAAASGRVYPGAGTPVGSAMLFGYRAVEKISSQAQVKASA